MAEREFRKALRMGGKQGSVGVVIPLEFREAMKIEAKTNLQIDFVDGKLIIVNADADLQPKREAKR